MSSRENSSLGKDYMTSRWDNKPSCLTIPVTKHSLNHKQSAMVLQQQTVERADRTRVMGVITANKRREGMLPSSFLLPRKQSTGSEGVSTETNGITMFQYNSTAPFKLHNKTQHVLIIVFIIEIQDSRELKDTLALEPRVPEVNSSSLHKLPNFAVPKFSPLKDEDNKSIMVPIFHSTAIYKY